MLTICSCLIGPIWLVFAADLDSIPQTHVSTRKINRNRWRWFSPVVMFDTFAFQVISLNKLSSDLCYTECGDGGCRCVKNATSIVDQLYVTSTKGDILSCICGDFQVNPHRRPYTDKTGLCVTKNKKKKTKKSYTRIASHFACISI